MAPLSIVLAVLGIVALGVAIYAAVEVVRLAHRTERVVAHLEQTLPPLLEKIDVAVDAANVELLRIDGIVSDVENVSDTVSTATDVIKSPVEALSSLGGRIARAISRARRS
ncbi:hypothetical protein MX659_06185 [Coriobacteriia bacterium Es71-Z0120]|uniref:hypothetical protein n=1 Tax=Parvivirga hydrogeniphila TaxID=2939460 RepID=UPI0022608425|nr:hypothetical protein [Parvivirga hydrogeniphila]MCL4079174.1 hypothetical protein [Parvivirga hydrogeniphila]